MYKFYFKFCSIQFPQFFLIFFVISFLIHIFYLEMLFNFQLFWIF